MYILDTDHATLLQRGDLRLNYRLRDLQPNQLATTIITYEEQLTGRLAVVRRARSGEARREAYYWLHKTLDFFCRLPVLTLDEKAAEIYEHFKAEKIRIGTQDLLIGAIVRANESILLTRNTKDFERIPDIQIEDWSL